MPVYFGFGFALSVVERVSELATSQRAARDATHQRRAGTPRGLIRSRAGPSTADCSYVSPSGTSPIAATTATSYNEDEILIEEKPSIPSSDPALWQHILSNSWNWLLHKSALNRHWANNIVVMVWVSSSVPDHTT
ncbi:hypothetical protein EVAR_25783_1 [Eumeta japonica]|uniref:Uncharacterized protein n=1 Tax=Eumeta variegata TaxID=151549 RepID=A0A4C1VSS2_EUMVA|nr:hypothetical protein EVAR_25783_1 [Eumeta japonica]